MHSIGFKKENHFELIRRHYLEICRVILVRRRIQAAPIVGYQQGVFAVSNVFRSLEHHVLEQMSEAGPPLSLVARADVICKGERYYRSIVILYGDHSEPVPQHRVLELNASGPWPGACREHKRQDGDQTNRSVHS